MSWLNWLLSRSSIHTAGGVQDGDGDADWSDISLEESSKLDGGVPSLFSTELPPCGLLAQVGYENVIERLRKLWLQQTNEHPDTTSVVSICAVVKEELDTEAARTGPRQPWRREEVFRYEVRWAKYFIREAKDQEKMPTMDENDLERLGQKDRIQPIPKDLRIYVKNNAQREAINKGWENWIGNKRQSVVATLVMGAESDGDGAGEPVGESDASIQPIADAAPDADESSQTEQN